MKYSRWCRLITSLPAIVLPLALSTFAVVACNADEAPLANLTDAELTNIAAMFTTDLKKAADRFNTADRLASSKDDYTVFFGDIVEAYGLDKFEAFLNKHFPLKLYDYPLRSAHCARVRYFGGEYFDRAFVWKMLVASSSLDVCVFRTSTEGNFLSAGVHTQLWFEPP